MENTNLSEEAIALNLLNENISDLELYLEHLKSELLIKTSKLEKLKERKKSLLNYLNTDNN